MNHKQTTQRMEKSLYSLQQSVTRIRTGIASPTILEDIKIDYYGTLTPIQHLANISIPEPRALLIQPFEKATLAPIEKAIQSSDLGINPIVDKNTIRLSLPIITTEKRTELAKKVRTLGEDCKISVRNIRRDQNDQLKKEGGLSEDEIKKETTAIQTITDDFISQVDKLVKEKETNIMEI